MFEQDVRIKKTAIKDVCINGQCLLLKGEYELGGATYASESLVFCGFRGNKVATGVWGGVYLFDTKGSKPPEKSITVAQLDKALAPKESNTKKRG